MSENGTSERQNGMKKSERADTKNSTSMKHEKRNDIKPRQTHFSMVYIFGEQVEHRQQQKRRRHHHHPASSSQQQILFFFRSLSTKKGGPVFERYDDLSARMHWVRWNKWKQMMFYVEETCWFMQVIIFGISK